MLVEFGPILSVLYCVLNGVQSLEVVPLEFVVSRECSMAARFPGVPYGCQYPSSSVFAQVIIILWRPHDALLE